MAKQRTKSWQDIHYQQKRLQDELKRQSDEARALGDYDRAAQLMERMHRVNTKGDLYKENIYYQKADQRDRRKLDKLVDRYNDDHENNRRVNEEYTKIADRNGKRQWARSTYMTGKTGNNGG